MRKSMVKMAAICAAATMMACAGGKQTIDPAQLNGEWNIENVKGEKVTAEETPFLGFDVKEQRVYGSTGCNQLTGSLPVDSLAQGVIDFGAMGSTRKMCQDMKAEQAILGALATVEGFSFDKEGKLVLTDGEGKNVMRLEKK